MGAVLGASHTGPSTAIGGNRDKDKIFPIQMENLEELSVQQQALKQ